MAPNVPSTAGDVSSHPGWVSRPAWVRCPKRRASGGWHQAGKRAAARGQGTMGTGDTHMMDAGGSAVRTRKQPDGVCPAHRSQTGFGQSAGDFKPFLRHKGHRNKMPVRRRGSAASRKRGLHMPVRNTQGASRDGLLQKISFFRGGEKKKKNL